MAQNLANADAILKDDYIGPIIEELNQKSFLLDRIQRSSDLLDHTGRRAIIPLHKNRNQATGSIGDGGTLPSAGAEQYVDAVVSIRYHMQPIELTDASITATESNDGAFISLLKNETTQAAVNMRKNISRMFWGTGDGLLGTCGTTSGSTTVVMGTTSDVQYIKIGQVVDILVKSSGATSTGAVATTVTARDVANHTVTVGASVTTDSTFGVYISGNRNNESDGIRNIVSTGRTLHSVDSTAAGNAFWDAASRNVGTSAAVTAVAGESIIEQLYDDVGAAGNGDVDVFLTSRGVRRRLADQFSSLKRFNDAQATTIPAGYSAIMVNNTPCITDDDAPKTFLFGLNEDSFRVFQQGPVDWLKPSGDGSIFQMKVAAAGSYSASWQAWLRWNCALACVAPNRNGRLQFCTDDVPVTNNN